MEFRNVFEQRSFFQTIRVDAFCFDFGRFQSSAREIQNEAVVTNLQVKNVNKL